MARWGRARTLALLLLLTPAASGCRRGGQPEGQQGRQAQGDVLVGAPWPWKRRSTMLYDKGLEMGVQEVNAGGGVLGRHLRLMPVDDEETVDTGRRVAQRLAAEPGVVAVVGHLQSYVTQPAAAIYDNAGLLMIAPAATTPDLTRQGYRRVFRAIFTDDQVGRQMAEYASRRGYRRAAISYVRSDYGREMANAFEERASERGLSVVARDSYDPEVEPGAPGLARVVGEWKGKTPDVIFIAGEAAHAAALVAAARAQGLKVPVLGGDALGTAELFGQGQEVVEGTVVAAPFAADEPRPEVARFSAEFVKRYGRPPDAAAALGYDAVRLLAHAMNAAHSVAPDEVARALHALSAWPGVTGPFSFTPQGDRVGRSLIKIVAHQGRFQHLPETDTAAGATTAGQ